jgi:hypothetical protein
MLSKLLKDSLLGALPVVVQRSLKVGVEVHDGLVTNEEIKYRGHY